MPDHQPSLAGQIRAEQLVVLTMLNDLGFGLQQSILFSLLLLIRRTMSLKYFGEKASGYRATTAVLYTSTTPPMILFSRILPNLVLKRSSYFLLLLKEFLGVFQSNCRVTSVSFGKDQCLLLTNNVLVVANYVRKVSCLVSKVVGSSLPSIVTYA